MTGKKRPTKRELSVVMPVFDPLVFLSHFIIGAKLKRHCNCVGTMAQTIICRHRIRQRGRVYRRRLLKDSKL